MKDIYNSIKSYKSKYIKHKHYCSYSAPTINIDVRNKTGNCNTVLIGKKLPAIT